ncbi:protein HymB [Acetomicrobium hydrogeniformans ATCC BAA-1850]|jgi:NADH:ubiquinone oxidoreductase subunit F (NADH-binding)/(2Fe-2S) ferredoxin/NAD-dependent dihydropyrimidine dehydrogenase PreA subunit|uniref:Protein HymB n=2 Tax=Acetomicrobium hydrogeniformans TaxID=649746 RepID=A0A0T5X949_9BACT|nr:protein HymB [Acetomicrobium hydrogeniformans ATCC BAA-1850]
MKAFKDELVKKGLDREVMLVETGCHGMCEMGPVVVVYPEGAFYCRVMPEDVPEIVEEHLYKGRIVQRLLYTVPQDMEKVPYYRDIPFYSKQHRIVLSNCGYIDPEKIEEYIARDGYIALGKALLEMTPEEVLDEVKKSGLRGRGGAGFPTGLKWEFARKAPGNKKYVICNADEGDPGAFMDRSTLEGDPHSVIEGMALGAYAIGADEGYIYCRAEYPLAIKRLKIAIAQAEEMGLLGDNIMGTNFSFHLHLKEGAGAFVCGEETALMASIEGRRGMPRPRPPFPAQHGLWGKPTNINNVETWANVPKIILNGADWFASMGTEKSKGTKIFALTGKITNTGLIEVPMGITIKEIIYELGGGILNGKEFKAVQIGGPSGGCLTKEHLDLPIDYESLTGAGAIMGSGGLVVMDEDTCMVDVARFFLEFTQRESCGKCVPCREGTKQMLLMLEKICKGEGTLEDLSKLEELAYMVKETSLCGLGQTAPNPVITTIRYFRDEYLAHIEEKRCPAKVCPALIKYVVDPDKCRKCGLCARNCPVKCISGDRQTPYFIDQEKCIKCGTCMQVCPFGVIAKV